MAWDAGLVTEQLKHLRSASYDVRRMHQSDWDRRDMIYIAPVEFSQVIPPTSQPGSSVHGEKASRDEETEAVEDGGDGEGDGGKQSG